MSKRDDKLALRALVAALEAQTELLRSVLARLESMDAKLDAHEQ